MDSEGGWAKGCSHGCSSACTPPTTRLPSQCPAGTACTWPPSQASPRQTQTPTRPESLPVSPQRLPGSSVTPATREYHPVFSSLALTCTDSMHAEDRASGRNEGPWEPQPPQCPLSLSVHVLEPGMVAQACNLRTREVGGWGVQGHPGALVNTLQNCLSSNFPLGQVCTITEDCTTLMGAVRVCNMPISNKALLTKEKRQEHGHSRTHITANSSPAIKIQF